jgi:hypothetical protein
LRRLSVVAGPPHTPVQSSVAVELHTCCCCSRRHHGAAPADARAVDNGRASGHAGAVVIAVVAGIGVAGTAVVVDGRASPHAGAVLDGAVVYGVIVAGAAVITTTASPPHVPAQSWTFHRPKSAQLVPKFRGFA